MPEDLECIKYIGLIFIDKSSDTSKLKRCALTEASIIFKR
jgi:hypothetical protein